MEDRAYVVTSDGLRTVDVSVPAAPAEICRVLTGHLENLYAFYGEYTGVRMARKHIAWYSKHQRDGNRFRQRINQTETATEQLEYVNAYFAALTEQRMLAA